MVQIFELAVAGGFFQFVGVFAMSFLACILISLLVRYLVYLILILTRGWPENLPSLGSFLSIGAERKLPE